MAGSIQKQKTDSIPKEVDDVQVNFRHDSNRDNFAIFSI